MEAKALRSSQPLVGISRNSRLQNTALKPDNHGAEVNGSLGFIINWKKEGTSSHRTGKEMTNTKRFNPQNLRKEK